MPQWLRPGDLLVRNDTKVLASRLGGHGPHGGRIEVLLVQREGCDGTGEIWSCLARPGRRLHPGERVRLDGGIEGVWLDAEGGLRRLRVLSDRPVLEVLEEVGEMPLPPYIGRRPDAADRERYQTVYARAPGSVAAPTAGLHFTPSLLERLSQMGVECRSLTLHVGPGTFLPVRSETVEGHRMLPEEAEIPAETARAVGAARRGGRRVVAVGTTTVRALEGMLGESPEEARKGWVSLFIHPGFRFHVVDAMITNFHLPRSTLLMLVSAFAGRDLVLRAYREAASAGYRFFSYGDAMLIL
ncbi:MAG: tRNA preQ1(34) S-adenosylmethionine ribosyltransferase-isomerase QueA [Candidatus Binatia bacterium]